jgi:LmbE family N-acetylglucosaminyl deacetylase
MEAVFQKDFLVLDSDSQLLLIAPHPDDESLGCGVVLQRAVRAGAAIRVVYATDGEDNPWPHRLIERKWRLSADDRKRWGQTRRAEALAALNVLGVRPSDVRFLGLPDQGLTNLLKRDCRSTIERFAEIIRDWSPTHLLIPSVADTHPDHNALAVILRLALAKFFPHGHEISVWSYTIHGQGRAFLDRAQQDRQSEAETSTKVRAIRCHKTQLRLSRRRFLAYACRLERFLRLSLREHTPVDGSIRSISRKSRALHLDLQLSRKPFGNGAPRISFFGYDRVEGLQCVATHIPRHAGRVEMRDVAGGWRVGLAEYRGDGFAGQLTVPTDSFSPAHALFVKVERPRFWFFDEAGWLEIPPTETLSAPSAQFVRQVALHGEVPLKTAVSGRVPAIARPQPRWAVLFAAVFIWLATALSANITRPWINALDYNGAVWSQSAHNILRAGLAETLGASSGFYFGPLPIPAWGYYLHHPPLLHLVITALFAVLGEHEWVARLLPIGCSLTSVILFVAVSSELCWKSERDIERRGVCMSADGASLWTNGKLRAVRVDAHPRRAPLPAILGPLGKASLEARRTRLHPRRTLGRLGDVHLRCLAVRLVVGPFAGSQAFRSDSANRGAVLRGGLSHSDSDYAARRVAKPSSRTGRTPWLWR